MREQDKEDYKMQLILLTAAILIGRSNLPLAIAEDPASGAALLLDQIDTATNRKFEAR